jgi:osmoprotectant transport system substrate-binding protein
MKKFILSILSVFMLVTVMFTGCTNKKDVVTISSCNWAGMKFDQAILVEGLKRYHPEVKVKVNELGSLAMIYATAFDKSSDVVISSDGSFGLTMFNDIPWEHNMTKFIENTEIKLNAIGYTQRIFNVDNNYAFFTSKDNFIKMGLTTMSEVAKLPNIKYGCEFSIYERDSDVNFKKALAYYNSVSTDVTPADNNVLYEAVSRGSIDVFLGETGSGYEKKYNLVELKDDKEFFPQYKHSLIYKTDINPAVVDVVNKMISKLTTNIAEDYILSVLNEEATWESIAIDFWDKY